MALNPANLNRLDRSYATNSLSTSSLTTASTPSSSGYIAHSQCLRQPFASLLQRETSAGLFTQISQAKSQQPRQENSSRAQDNHESRDHRGIFILAADHKIQLPQRQCPASMGRQERDVTDVARGGNEIDDTHGHQHGCHQRQYDLAISEPPIRAGSQRCLLHLGADLQEIALYHLCSQRHAADHRGDNEKRNRAVERAKDRRAEKQPHQTDA